MAEIRYDTRQLTWVADSHPRGDVGAELHALEGNAFDGGICILAGLRECVAQGCDAQDTPAVGEDGTVGVWEANTGNEIAHMKHKASKLHEVTTIAFSPDGQYILSASYDGSARVWKASTENEIPRMANEIVRMAHEAKVTD